MTPRIRAYSAAQVRAAEKPLLDAGVPLMRQASAALATELRRRLESLSDDAGRPARVLLLIGAGDNGGDALYAGAELARDGADVRLLQVGSRRHEAGWAAAVAAGARPVPAVDANTEAVRADVIVDGILGTGTSSDPALRGTARSVVAAILPALGRRPRPLVVAVDLPSGIAPDDGGVSDPTVLPADVTVTFGALKAGLLLPPAAELAGDIVLVDLGLSFEGVDPLIDRGDSESA
ncbi:NAD(P)H-hydrate epimerase [Microbacterium sp. 18062]|uniref:NAD(P)H-hydrate epimerase n=1 Tax=Microbacterium sp. 18062 TaxID=2681410 RepID=UPI00135C453D|nr:NAD(P)H-hydrate epimerase [Microbacterium sp. 18062]